MVRNGRALPLLAVFTAIAFPACPHRPPDVPVEKRLTDAQSLLAAMRQRGELLGSIRLSGTIAMRRGNRRVKAHMVALARRPSQLRFETASFFDQPLSILVTDGMSFSLWDMDQGRFLRGPATPANISRVVPLLMDGPEVVGILLGDPPQIAYAKAELTYDQGKGLYLLTLSNSRERQEIWVHPFRLRPEEVTCRNGEKLLYHLTFEDWSGEEGQATVPLKVSFEMPAQEIQLTLHIQEAERNPVLEDKLFTLEAPEGVVVEPVD